MVLLEDGYINMRVSLSYSQLDFCHCLFLSVLCICVSLMLVFLFRMGLKCLRLPAIRQQRCGIWTPTKLSRSHSMMVRSRPFTGSSRPPTRVWWRAVGIKRSRWVWSRRKLVFGSNYMKYNVRIDPSHLVWCFLLVAERCLWESGLNSLAWKCSARVGAIREKINLYFTNDEWCFEMWTTRVWNMTRLKPYCWKT